MITCERCSGGVAPIGSIEAYNGITCDKTALELMKSDVCYWCALKESYVVKSGYTECVDIDKNIGATELTMYMGIAGKVAHKVRRMPGKENYGYVMSEDGVWIHGNLHEFDDVINIS